MNNVCHYIMYNNCVLAHYTYFKQQLAENDDYYIGGNVSINNYIVQKLTEILKHDVIIVDVNDELGLVAFFYKNRYGYICELSNTWFINLGSVIN